MNILERNNTFSLQILVSTSLLLLFLLSSCRKEESIFEINEVKVTQSNIDKNGIKKDIEFISQAYSDLFEKPISNDALNQSIIAYKSIGDKDLVKDMIIRDLLNRNSLVLPDIAAIHADLDFFVQNTYKKFYKRFPAPFELWTLRTMIQQHPDMKAQEIYYAFMSSNEYSFY